MALSRREFVKGSLMAVGTAAATLGGLGLVSNVLADTAPGEGADQAGPRRLRYIDLERSGELARREEALWELYSPCRLCPRLCGVNRAAGESGACTSASSFRVASFGPHHGEEAPLRGRRGSGTIFFSHCNLLCIFCINWEIAHRGGGRYTTPAELADMMLDLQRRGCHNINLVTPSHIVPHLISALRLAIAEGLHIPLLYNSSGYDPLEVIQLLDGIVDIYLPDFKFQDAEVAARFTQGAPDYPRHAAAAVKEMHRQVGDLHIVDGLAQSGVLIRHLVMPENLAGTDKFVRWVANELSPNTHVNIMSQYTPMFRANEFPPLDRRLTQAEFSQAMTWAREAGLHNFH